MFLGEIISRLQEPAFADETLLSLDDLVLTSRIAEAAAKAGQSRSQFAMQSVSRFVDGASDEEWLTLIGAMSRSADPAREFLRRALACAIAEPRGAQVPA